MRITSLLVCLKILVLRMLTSGGSPEEQHPNHVLPQDFSSVNAYLWRKS